MPPRRRSAAMPRRPLRSGFGGAVQRLRWLAEAALFDVAAATVGRATPRARLAIGSALGTAFWAVDARHRRAAARNIALAYGDQLSSREVRRLTLASMRHFTRMMVETVAFPRLPFEEAKKHVTVEGIEHLRAAYGRGRGMLGFSGHLGNWELMSFMFGRLGMPATGIARPLDNPYLQERLIRLRTLSGNRIINARGAFREALAVLKGGGFVGIWIDQRPKRGGVLVPFFGTDAYTASGLARLALDSEAAVVPCFAVQETDGSWRMVIEPEVPLVRTGDFEADCYRITADCTAILERWIRRYPEQWLWTHAKLKP